MANERSASQSPTTYLVLTHIAACQKSITAAPIVTERMVGIAYFVRNIYMLMLNKHLVRHFSKMSPPHFTCLTLLDPPSPWS